MRDFLYCIRLLRRSPGFTTVAILSLALGIGANTAIFSASWVLLSQPLQVRDPGSLLAITNEFTIPRGMRGVSQINGSMFRDPTSGRGYRATLSYPAYEALRDAATDTADVFGYSFVREVNIALDGLSTTGAAALVSGNYFTGSGAAIALGRALTGDDDRVGASAAVISHRFWTSALGSDPAVVGRPIRINGVPFTIVGVSGPGFTGMSRGGFFPPMDITIPLHAQPAVVPAWAPVGESLFANDSVFWIHSMARLHAGTPIAQLEAKLSASFAAWMKASSALSYQQATGVEVHLLPGGGGLDVLSPRIEQPVRILTAVSAIVLLLACVNLANLMLARGVARAKEISIRLALGSSRRRLIQQALVESLILSVAGAGLGLWIGVFGGRILLRILSSNTGPVAMTLDVNWRMLAVTAAIACVATMLCGVLPAMRLVRRSVVPSMKSTVGATTGAPRLRPATILMAVQVAASLPLVAGAGLFLQTINNLERVDLGFNPERLVSFRIDPSLSGYERTRVEQVYEQVLDRIRRTTGVSSATLVTEPLLAGFSSNTSMLLADGTRREVYFNRIGPDYFATFGIPVVAGRAIEARDHLKAPRVAVINQAAATALFGAEPPIGQRVNLLTVDAEVVGVVRDTKYDSIRKAAVPTVFLSYLQTTPPLTLGAMHVVARTTVAPAALTSTFRSVVASVDGDVPVSRMTTQAEQIEASIGTELAFTRLLVAFGAFALFLACIGLHGLTAYAVARRTSEIGLRVALGAQRGDVLWLILRQGVIVTTLGLAAGIPITITASKAVASLLYGVTPLDPASLATATVVLMVVAGMAAYVPARRAATLDPLAALRIE